MSATVNTNNIDTTEDQEVSRAMVSFVVDPVLWSDLKIHAAIHGTTRRAVVDEGLRQYLERHYAECERCRGMQR